MSDPYTEATRDERKGMSTLARVFLIGGGLVVAALVALFIWFSVSVDRMFRSIPAAPPPHPPAEVTRGEAVQGAAELEESLRRRQVELEESLKRSAEQAQVEAALQESRQELVAARTRLEAAERDRVRQELVESVRRNQEVMAARLAQQAEALAEARREEARAMEEAAAAANLQQRESPRAPAQESIAEELNLAVNSVLKSVFEDAGFSVEPVEEGVGLSFDIRSKTVSTRFDYDLVSDPEMLNRVSRGEGRLADLWPDDAAERAGAATKPLPEWVPVFPGADRKSSLSMEAGDLALGVDVFLADAPGHEVILWYFRAADRKERAGTELSLRQRRSEAQADPVGELGRFAMHWEDRQVSVFVTEDDHGDSMFVLVYKGSTKGDGND